MTKSAAGVSLLVVFGSYFFWPSTVVAQAGQPCPSETIDVVNGDLNPQPDTETITVDLLPCQTLTVEFVGSVASTNSQAASVSFSVAIRNALSELLISRAFTCQTSCTASVPASGDLVGYPLPGTRGVRGLAHHIYIRWIGSSANASAPTTHVLTITKRPRFDYNSGGDGVANAQELTLPRMVFASLHHWETGQYYKVWLEPGGRLKMSGTAECRNPSQACNLIISVQNPRTGQNPVMLSTAIPPLQTSPFAAPDFVNTGSSRADFFVRVRTGNTHPLYDLKLMLEDETLQRKLTLFLDADFTTPFSVEIPQSDDAQYIPGANLVGGSVALPQQLQLIAGFTDSSGRIVPPPNTPTDVTFSLNGTSAFTGIAMNSGAGTDPDFQLDATTAAIGSDGTARVGLKCLDYAGFTGVSASAAGHSTNLDLPKDSTGDWLPDIGWFVGGVLVVAEGLTRDADNDSDPAVLTPPSTGLIGDGLTVFQEYRGFIVDGTHVRTNPSKKDVFITYIQAGGWEVGFATNLPLKVHQIRGEDEFPGVAEYSAGRIINANRSNGNLSVGSIVGDDQRALRLYDTHDYNYGMFGSACHIITDGFEPCELWPLTHGVPPSPLTPNTTSQVKVWVQSHNDLALPANHQDCPPSAECPYTPEQVANEVRRTIAHEVGHAVGMCHHGQCAPLDDSGVGDSAMTSGFVEGPPATDSRSKYNSFDVQQIRLHNR